MQLTGSNLELALRSVQFLGEGDFFKYPVMFYKGGKEGDEEGVRVGDSGIQNQPFQETLHTVSLDPVSRGQRFVFQMLQELTKIIYQDPEIGYVRPLGFSW